MIRRSGWVLFAITTVLLAISIVLQELSRYTIFVVFNVGEAFLLTAFGIVGAVIIRRQPRNAIGWIFSFTALLVAGDRFAGANCVFGLERLDGCPDVAAWIGGTYWPSGIAIVLLVAYLPLLYPTGRFLSSRWKMVGVLIAINALIHVLLTAFVPRRFEDPFETMINPFGIASLAGAEGLLEVMNPTLLVMLVLGLVSLGLRLKRSRGVERQQMKWFFYAIGILLLNFVLGAVAEAVDPGGLSNDIVGGIVFLFAASGLPIAVGIAVTRYRLYDVDRIINRTLVYVGLTGFLGAVYVGTVVALSQLLPVGGSELTMVASTLLAASLFSPARRRIQAFIDRRFYRARYDVQKTIEAFGTRLRDEVDLETLGRNLKDVVAQTLHPSAVIVWMREPEEAE